MADEMKMSAAERLEELELRVRNGLVKVSKTGTTEEVTTWYSQHSNDYYELGLVDQYDDGCEALAKALAKWVPNKEARILDVAAGTGEVGRQLRLLGYTNIDAIEPSEGMRKYAMAANIYNNNYIDEIVTPDQQINVNEDTYDALCLGGSVFTGHITLDCLPELMRITKKGGVIVFNVAQKYLSEDPEFLNERHHVIFQKYVENGQLTRWDHFRAPYRYTKVPGYTEDCQIYRMVVAAQNESNNNK